MAAMNTGDEQLRYECTRLNGMLDRDLPPRSNIADMPATSPNNLHASQCIALTVEQELLYLGEVVRQVTFLCYEDNGKWMFSSGSIWKAVFRVCQDKALCPAGSADYSGFEKLALNLGFDIDGYCRIPFDKSYIENMSKDLYKQFLNPLSTWSTKGLKGRSLSFARDMISVKDELLKRFDKMGIR